MAKYCKNCGTQLEEGARFCAGCGTQTVSESVQPPVHEQPAYQPPEQFGQYAQQQPPAAGKPSGNKTLFIMIGIIAAVVVVLLLVFNLNGSGGKTPASPPSPGEPPASDEPVDIVPLPEEIDGSDPDETHILGSINDFDFPRHVSAGNPTVFSFESIAPMDLPRGELSINQIIDKYGPANTITGYYLESYGIVYVNIYYYDMVIYFSPIFADAFSFYDRSLSEDTYPIEEIDWDITLDVISIRIFDPTTQLPYGLKIGATTREQIIAFYGEEPAFTFEYDLIQYNYYDLDKNGNLPDGVDVYGTGNISFLFDENDVLDTVIVEWSYYDL
jgi:hypothetical protein